MFYFRLLQRKANFFNKFFASICAPIKSIVCYLPFYRVSSFYVVNKDKDVLSIIKSLDSVKSHGYDNVAIKIIKNCSDSVSIPLKTIIEESFKKGLFPEIWKKANAVPVHKKQDKTFIKNYHPISLISIFGKTFKKVICNCLLNHFLSKNIFTPFKLGSFFQETHVLPSFYQ